LTRNRPGGTGEAPNSGPVRLDAAAGPDRPRRFLADTAGGQLQVTWCGPGQDIVVLLHHAPSSSVCWTEVLPEFAIRGRCAWAIDLPGYGGSDRADRPVTGPGPELAWYADRMAEVIATTGRPAVLVGRQTGAAVAAAVAVRRPELASSLVLWGYPDFGEPLRSVLAAEQTPELGPDLTPAHQFASDLRSHDRRAMAGAAGADGYVRQALADHLRAGPAQHWAHNAVARADLGRLARAVQHHTLVIYDLARTDLPAQQAATGRVLGNLRHGELLDLPGVSSSLEAGRAGPFADAVLGFAARVPRREPTPPVPPRRTT
jgi:pimeloyl-ACP methyl ester carboxylesterase